MNNAPLLERITVHSKLLAGKPTLRGLRISVEQILRTLGSGTTEDELLQEYPDLEREDFQAVYAYAADQISATQSGSNFTPLFHKRSLAGCLSEYAKDRPLAMRN